MGSRRRILFVSHTAEWIGPNVSLAQLVRHLDASFEPLVLFPGDGPLREELERQGVTHFAVPSLGKTSILATASLIRRERIDLVYGNSAAGASKNALIAARLTGRPFVYHLREMLGTGGWRKTAFLRYADAVIAVSEATARDYARFVNRPVEVVHNGVPIGDFDCDRDAARDRLLGLANLGPNSKTVVSVGNVYERKGQDRAIRAMSDVVRSEPSAHLLLFGRLDRDPAYVSRLRAEIDESGLGSSVTILGLRRDLPELLAGADVMIHTALVDPHPRAVIESMAAGLPVIAFAVDGVAESVIDGETGLLVTPDDVPALSGAVRKLLGDAATRDRMGREGRERASRLFSDRRTAERVGSILRTVLDRRGVT